jgi:hypothetical protein
VTYSHPAGTLLFQVFSSCQNPVDGQCFGTIWTTLVFHFSSWEGHGSLETPTSIYNGSNHISSWFW